MKLKKSVIASLYLLLLLFVACSSDKGEQRELKENTPKEAPTMGLMKDVIPAVPSLKQARMLQCAIDLENKEMIFHNTSKRTSKEINVWVYGYKGEAMVSREAKRIPLALEPAAKKSVGMGILMEEEHTECEVTEVLFLDESRWKNNNLVYSSNRPRPIGGESLSWLEQRDTLQVRALWIPTKGSSQVMLENISERPIHVEQVDVSFLDEKGKVLRKSATRVIVDLKPSDKKQVPLPLSKESLPAGYDAVEVTVSRLLFLDGKREIWSSLNH